MVVSGHAATTASFQRRIRLPRAESSRGADAHFRQTAGLRGVRGGDRTSEGPVTDARVGVVCPPQSLAFRALAAGRRRPVGVHALVDGYSHPALARRASDSGHRPAVSRALQVVPRPGRRPFVDRAAVRGAKSAARKSRRSGRPVAVVESLASGAWRPARTGGRRAAGTAAPLAAACPDAANRSRTRCLAPVSRSRLSVWRGVVARTDSNAAWPAVHLASTRPPMATIIRIKTPDPFRFSQKECPALGRGGIGGACGLTPGRCRLARLPEKENL